MSSEELLKKAQNALRLEPRERFKTLKQIGYEALQEFKLSKELSIDDLKNYKEILNIAINVVPGISNIYRLGQTKIIKKYLELLGCDNPKILFKKSTGIELFSGCIAIGDQSYAGTPNDIEFMNSGKAYFFSTGSDGPFNIQVRIVDGLEPVLTSKEYKRVTKSSRTIILHFPTGKLSIGDGQIWAEEKPITSIEPGNYKCNVFVFTFPNDVYHDNFSYYIVLSKCDDLPINNETETILLEPDF